MKLFSIIKQVGFSKFIMAGISEVYRKVIREKFYGSYAQDYEDILMEKLLPKKKGFYLEIGGYHPSRLSNTFRFYKKGWRGVVVEPNPEVKTLFEKLRPADKFFNKGIGVGSSILDYFKYEIPALNTFDKQQVARNKTKGYIATKIEEVEIIEIKNFLKKYINQEIDILSLDVEGWDGRILKNWDWKYKPKIICVETDTTGKIIEEILDNKNYSLMGNTIHNSIFMLKD